MKKQEFQDRKDVGLIVKNLASEIRKNKPGKWKLERDEIIAAWLEPSGLQWQTTAEQQKITTPAPTTVGNDLLVAIENLTSFKDYQQNKDIIINKLDKPCAEALKVKLSKFNCKRARRRTPEAKAWKQITDRLKKLKQ